MKHWILIAISYLLLFTASFSAYSQTIDPYCHVEVVSGSPAIFNLSTLDDITNGKTLTYSSRIRVFFFKAPSKWTFCAKSNALFFDGPSSDLSVQTVKINVEHLYFNKDVDVQPGDFDDYGWNANSYVELTENGTELAQGWIKNNQFGSRYTIDFVVRFSIQPVDFSMLSDKIAGYYASQACFYVYADYF